MADQAQGLRALAHRTRRAVELEPTALVSTPRTARTIAVTSGKGGVGKSSLTANLALLFARAGENVVVLDADLGLANVHLLLGAAPPFHLEQVISGEKRLSEIVHPVRERVGILAGGSGIDEIANLSDRQRSDLIESLAELDRMASLVLIDTGAGLSRNVLGFVLAAPEVLLVTTPEPTSMADAYAMIKVVSRDSPQTRIRLIVNMAANEAEGRAAAQRLQLVSRRFLKVEIETLDSLPLDPALPRSVRAQKAIVESHANSPASAAIARIASQLGCASPAHPGARGFVNRVVRYFTNPNSPANVTGNGELCDSHRFDRATDRIVPGGRGL